MADWFSTLDADAQAHLTGKGWNTLDPTAAAVEATKAHFAAQKLIGHPPDQVVKLPKDATDPSYQGIYDRVVGMGAPKTPEEYVFDGVKRKDGTDFAADDAAFVRDLAVKYKLPVTAARGMAEALAARFDASADVTHSQHETTKAANNASLMQAWGSAYDAKTFAATRAATAAGFSPAVLAHMAGLPADEYRENMNALVALGEKMGEAAMLRGGSAMPRDPTAGMTPDDAGKRLASLGTDKVWTQKFLASDATVLDEWKKLTVIVASARVPPR